MIRKRDPMFYKIATITLLTANLAATGTMAYLLLKGKTHMEQELVKTKAKANHALTMFKRGLDDLEL